MRRTCLILMLTLLTAAAWSIPAKRGQWRMLTLTDGTQVRAELRGDEHMHFWQTDDGRYYVERPDQLFEPADMEALTEKAMERRALRKKKGATGSDSAQPLRIPLGGEHTPYIGSKRGLIILVEFQNKSFEQGHDSLLFVDVANKENYKQGRFYGSVHDYFLAQSRGQFDLTFDVAGPVMMPENYQYYGQGDDQNVGYMVAEACTAIDDYVNFADYDWDGDGNVDQVFLLYAGKGQADGGGTNTIWPHEWELHYTSYGQKLKLDDVVIDTYACGCELNGSGKLNGPGTICHEFSHCLGLPDMYDTKYNNYGMSSWSLMDSGCYNDNGYRPAGYTSYERMYCGWLEPVALEDEEVKVDGMEPLSEGGDAYIIHNSGNDDEYFLLENRYQSGWDAKLANSGLLIMHVDFDMKVWGANAVNTFGYYYDDRGNRYNNDHQRCTVVQADGSANNYSVAGDIYPYQDVNGLSAETTPAATWYNNTIFGNTAFEETISDITRQDNGRIAFSYKPARTQGDVITSETDTLFVETFDNCDDKGGNDDRWMGTIGIGDFKPDYQQWTCDYARGGDRCAKIGSTKVKASLISPLMRMDGDAYTVSFRAAPWYKESAQMILKVTAGRKTIAEYTLPEMTAEQWNDYEVDITADDDVILEFSATQHRFFIDEISVVKVVPSAIQEVKTAAPATQQPIYNLNGTPMGTNLDALPRGIYIVGGRKVVR